MVCGSACEAARRTELAHGEESSIIVLAADSLWAEIGDSVLAALEPRIFTVRDEKMFEATHTSPLTEEWLKLRTFRQVLALGVAGDGWVAPVLAGTAPAELPALVEAADVWARGQTVTAAVLPAQNAGAALLRLLPALHDRLDARFRAHAQSRMYLSDADTELRDTLRVRAGFSLLLPRIYTGNTLDSLYVFQNRTEVGGELVRTLVVAWRQGTVTDPDVEWVLTWRDAIVPLIYEPQTTGRERVASRKLEGKPAGSIEVQGIWQRADRSFPAAGPFLDRVIPCPAQDRTYFLEAWLYAPGRAKYEYMIQLETLLDSFECGPFGG
jgi:hypothetical protein